MMVLVASVAAFADSLFAQTQLELNERAGQSLKLANDELASAIQSYRRRFHGPGLALFDESQIVWESYRLATCEFESSGVSGGSVRPMVMSRCRERIAKERLRYIENVSKCEEGDLNCPAWNKGT